MQQIQDLTDVNAWNYVPSEKNPADLASRGINPGETSKLKLWLEGPQFLRNHDEYTRLFEEPIENPHDLELRSTCATEVCADVGALVAHYSNIKRLQKAIVWLKKFYKHLQGHSVTKELSANDIESSLLALIKIVQRLAFENELDALANQRTVAASSHLKSLNPILFDGVLRVGGRLENAVGVERESNYFAKSSSHTTFDPRCS